MLEILIGQIPEAIYFSLFLIFAKGLKKKRTLFTSIMIVEYLLLKRLLPFNVVFQLIYTFLIFLSLKVVYGKIAQITDIFAFSFASLYLIFASAITYAISYFTVKSFLFALIMNRIIIFSSLIIFNKKIKELYDKFKYLWNRHRNEKVKIRSLTLRNISIILFNIMFYIINIGMIFLLRHLK